jgi:hypothetical protein
MVVVPISEGQENIVTRPTPRYPAWCQPTQERTYAPQLSPPRPCSDRG